jgi:hypothetical protein
VNSVDEGCVVYDDYSNDNSSGDGDDAFGSKRPNFVRLIDQIPHIPHTFKFFRSRK